MVLTECWRQIQSLRGVTNDLVFCHNPISNLRCAGCTVVPGDWIVCDEHGVVAVPADLAAEISVQAADTDAKEEFVRELVEGGASTIDVYPPDEETLRGFPAWKAARKASQR